jgi:kynurenine formamidase
MSGRRAQPATVTIDGCTFRYDAAHPVSLAAPLDFAGLGPAWFPSPPPACEPLQAGGFSGRVATGASCNCSTLRLTPHCDGTHTECVGHLTLEVVDARDRLPAGILPALLLSVTPEQVGSDGAPSGEATVPPPLPGDRLLTRAALEAAWPEPRHALGADLPCAPRVLVLRTRRARATMPEAGAASQEADAAESAAVPPYLSLPAALWLVARGIEHLVLDLPSADRTQDEGQLSAHRAFFGLPAGSTALAEAQRAHCTITELARIPASLGAGFGLLEIQAPALAGDALPSRPLWHEVLAVQPA